MKIASLVPSWTETLIEAGADVVGRTRYCIHPQGRVEHIPSVSGTKDISFADLHATGADVVLLDKEENTREVAAAIKVPYLVTHVTSVSTCWREMQRLGRRLNLPRLIFWAGEWQTCLDALRENDGAGVRSVDENASVAPALGPEPVRHFPGITEWLREPQHPIRNIVYLIWQKPWMAVGRRTFVGSVLTCLGAGPYLPDSTERYFEVDLAAYDPKDTLLLFASEPFPFADHLAELQALEHPSALIDGEAFSWFGLRSLRFLQSTLPA